MKSEAAEPESLRMRGHIAHIPFSVVSSGLGESGGIRVCEVIEEARERLTLRSAVLS